jgi:hypothetical protein
VSPCIASDENVSNDGAHFRLCFIAWVFPIIALELCENA